nr:GMC family oxidoreductase N-terminal domain-containing protein [Sphingomonas sp. Y57]
MGGQEFDYVIVGAGAAGCALANKLSEDRTKRICIIEAGPPDDHMMIRIPAGFTKMIGNPRYTWAFETEPSPLTGNRAVPFVQGKTLGGSTSINGMVYVRGQPSDFDRWAEAGNKGWSFEELLPYFKALETRPCGDPDLSGDKGPLKVTPIRRRDAALQAFIDAAVESGLPVNPDYNARRQLGVAYTQTTTFRSRRISSASAFLKPAVARGNVHVVTDAVAQRIDFEDKRAVGVTYRRRGASHGVRAAAEVIVAAGSINTARLLQVSGVGDPDWLRAMGVPVIMALPGVGRNLRDHFLCTLVADGRNFKSINRLASGLPLAGQVARYYLGAESLLELVPPLVHWFANTGASEGDADIQGAFTPAAMGAGDAKSLARTDSMTICFWQHRPESTGFVRAVSTDISVPPIIQPNYLRHEVDRAAVVAGFRMARAFLHTRALLPYVKAETAPGADVASDQELLDYAGRTGGTAFHFSGTSKMGPESDPASVVDDELRVHGIFGLRVVDASIMPSLVSANTQTSTMMIGLKAGDMIRAADRTRNAAAI